MIIRTHDLNETSLLAGNFVERLRPELHEATILALSGDLGSGKTSFTQGVAKALGITEVVTSPTFVIEKIYQTQGSMLWKHLIHIDAYRLTDGKELLTLGFSEIIADPFNLIIIEWPERVENILPKNIKKINFTFIDENTREVSYDL